MDEIRQKIAHTTETEMFFGFHEISLILGYHEVYSNDTKESTKIVFCTKKYFLTPSETQQ